MYFFILFIITTPDACQLKRCSRLISGNDFRQSPQQSFCYSAFRLHLKSSVAVLLTLPSPVILLNAPLWDALSALKRVAGSEGNFNQQAHLPVLTLHKSLQHRNSLTELYLPFNWQLMIKFSS